MIGGLVSHADRRVLVDMSTKDDAGVVAAGFHVGGDGFEAGGDFGVGVDDRFQQVGAVVSRGDAGEVGAGDAAGAV